MNEPVPWIDTDTLAILEREVGAQVVSEVIQLFLEHGPGRLEAARAGRGAGDLKAVAEALHSIKSSAAMLGATRLHDLAETAERSAVEGDTAAVERLFRSFEQAFSKTIDVLRERRSD